MCGAVNAEHHKSVLGGKTRQEGEGKEDGWEELKSRSGWGDLGRNPSHPPLSTPSPWGPGAPFPLPSLFNPPNARSPVFHKRCKQHAVESERRCPKEDAGGEKKNARLLRLSERPRPLMSLPPCTAPTSARSEWAFRREMRCGMRCLGDRLPRHPFSGASSWPHCSPHMPREQGKAGGTEGLTGD